MDSSLALAGLSLLVSLLVALRTWRYSETNVRYSARNQYMNALFDIDRQLLNRPDLWAIYDDHYMAASKSAAVEDRARREAFLYYHLNLFETVFNDYNGSLTLNDRDQRFWESWQAWIVDFFRSSSEARTLFQKDIAQGIFHRQFVDHVNAIIGSLEAGTAQSLPPSIWRQSAGLRRGVT
jgi:hypothetical protein